MKENNNIFLTEEKSKWILTHEPTKEEIEFFKNCVPDADKVRQLVIENEQNKKNKEAE